MYPEKCSTSFYMVQGEKKNEIRGQAGSIRLPAHINNHADSSFSCFTYIHGTSTSVVVCQKQPDQHTIYSLCGCCRCIHDAGSFFYRWLRDDTQPEQDRYFLFRKEKDKRIGFPWIVCTLAFAPVLSLFVARQLGHDTSYLQMMGNLFWTKDYYYQDPYWFLGILLTFQLIIALADRSCRFKSFIGKIPTHIIIISLLLFPAVGYSLGSFFYGIDGWKSILYIWSFQPSRIIAYLCYFFCRVIF